MVPAILLTGIVAGGLAGAGSLFLGYGLLAAFGFYALAGVSTGLALGVAGYLCHLRHSLNPSPDGQPADA